MKEIKKIWVIVLAVFLSVFSVLFVVLQSPSLVLKAENADLYKWEDIMSRVNAENDRFGDISITDIAMLGAHDAFSYRINYKSMNNSSEETLSNNVFLRGAAKGLMVRLSIAQIHDAYTQLKAGIRYFDARITNIKGEFYTSHGLVSHKLFDTIVQIIRFLKENPGEFIIFHVPYFYKGSASQNDFAELLSVIKYENKTLYDFINYDTDLTVPSDITYNDVTSGGTKGGIVFVGLNEVDNDYARYFKINQVFAAWHNNINPERILEGVYDTCNKIKSNRLNYETLFRINQFQTTPQLSKPISTLLTWSLVGFARRNNIRSLDYKNIYDCLVATPIVIFDYATTTYGDFNNKINKKIMTYNMGL